MPQVLGKPDQQSDERPPSSRPGPRPEPSTAPSASGFLPRQATPRTHTGASVRVRRCWHRGARATRSEHWLWIPTLQPVRGVALGKLTSAHDPRLPHLRNGLMAHDLFVQTKPQKDSVA